MADVYSGTTAGNFELEVLLRELSGAKVAKKNMVFDGATTNDPGDYTGGTGNPATLFNVDGDVLVSLVAVCKTTLVGAATLEVGVTDATAALLAQIANATTFAVNEGWSDSTPSLAESISAHYHVIGGGLDIIQTVGTANITAGEIDYYCFWKPLTEGSEVRAAT